MHFLDLATAAAVLAVLIWLYLLLGRGRFWKVDSLTAPDVAAEVRGPIAVIMPARNEADVIARGITSLLDQTCATAPLHIFLVDDGSTDGTAALARAAASKLGKSDSLTVIEGRALPPGWSGKLWAVHQGIERARALGPRFFLLTDADIRHAPDNVRTLAAMAESGGYDVVSFMVKLHCQTFAEKLLVPAFVFFFFKLYPPAWIADPQRATAGAAGGCLLLRPEALTRAGGIEAIRGEIIDDCALARAVKRGGGKLWLGLTDSTFSLRPYNSFSQIVRMIARSAFSQLRHSALLLIAALIAMAATYLLPLALLFTGRPWPMMLGAAAWAVMTISYLPMVRFYRLSALWALALPLTAAFYMGATVHSALEFWLGRGGQWKGRVQDPVV